MPLVNSYDYDTLMHMGLPSVLPVEKKIIGKNCNADTFQSRKHYATRWDEVNCQVQCSACNVFRYGEQYIFGINLDKDFGDGTADSLHEASRQVVKFSNDDLLEKLEYYKQQIKNFSL